MALRVHLDRVYGAVAAARTRYQGQPLRTMGEGLVAEFLRAKFERIDVSLALYRISDDLEGAAIARAVGQQSAEAIAEMLRSSSERLQANVDVAASMLFGVMAGGSRRMLEAEDPHGARVALERELQVMVVAYLEARKAS